VPESVNVEPATGRNCQLKLEEFRVNSSTPYVVSFWTTLFGWIVPKAA
jgi:hypothetical protein